MIEAIRTRELHVPVDERKRLLPLELQPPFLQFVAQTLFVRSLE